MKCEETETFPLQQKKEEKIAKVESFMVHLFSNVMKFSSLCISSGKFALEIFHYAFTYISLCCYFESLQLFHHYLKLFASQKIIFNLNNMQTNSVKNYNHNTNYMVCFVRFYSNFLCCLSHSFCSWLLI